MDAAGARTQAPTVPQGAMSTDKAVALANRVLDLLLQEKFGDVTAMFAPQIKTARIGREATRRAAAGAARFGRSFEALGSQN